MERKHVGRRKRPKNPPPNSVSSFFLPTIHQDHSFLLFSKKKKPKMEEQESHHHHHDDDKMKMIMIPESSSSRLPTEASDLPSSILIEILGRLPFRSLTQCRYVCKSWRSLLTESYFYRMYSQQMPTSLILNLKGSSIKDLRQISIVETSVNLSEKFVSVKEMASSRTESSPSSSSAVVSMTMTRGVTILHKAGGFCKSSKLTRKVRFVKIARYRNLKTPDFNNLFGANFRFQLGNSCYGFVCVREIESREPIMVWNPMMAQFVVLPKPATISDDKVVAGFGFCGRTNRYKVLRVYHKKFDPPLNWRVEVYDLGVPGDQWREIGEAPYPIPSKIPGFYTNNLIHWILDDVDDDNYTSKSDLICCFDFIEERFKLVKPPPIFFNKRNKYYWSNLGIIGGCLSISAIDAKEFRADVQVWVMEEYGVPESWTLRLSIRDPTVDWCNPHRWIQITNYCKDHGEILMLVAHNFVLSYTLEDRKFCGLEGLQFPSIAVSPSLISLRDVLNERLGTGGLTVRYL